MLVLARKPGESLVIGGNVRVEVHRISKGCVRLAIDAPEDVTVDREEVWFRKQEEAKVPASRAAS
jgi:carbon storage regulator